MPPLVPVRYDATAAAVPHRPHERLVTQRPDRDGIPGYLFSPWPVGYAKNTEAKQDQAKHEENVGRDPGASCVTTSSGSCSRSDRRCGPPSDAALTNR